MFQPGAAGEGQVDGNALLVPHLIGRQTVRSESGDVEMERSVRLQVREASIWGLFVIPRGASSSRRLRQPKMTPQLCHHKPVSQTSSFYVCSGVSFSL